MSHTPLPWFVARSIIGNTHYIESRIRPGTIQEVAACGPTEGDEGSAGNAEFIVRAVNAHPDLVAALQAALAYNDAAMSADGTGQFSWAADARAALAKAEAA